MCSLWGGERASGTDREYLSIRLYQKNTEATALKIRDVVWEEVDENALREEIKRGSGVPGSIFGSDANASVERSRD